MILIISDENDMSADYALEWARYMDIKVLRANNPDLGNITKSLSIDAEVNITFRIKGESFTLADVTGVWFRRGYIHHSAPVQTIKDGTFRCFNEYLENENNTLTDFIIRTLLLKHGLGNQYRYNDSKLLALSNALMAGLKIPETYVGTDGDGLAGFFKNDAQPLITKSIQDALPIECEAGIIRPGVYEISSARSQKGKQFYYSQFQRRINKKYELRIFFLGCRLFTAATFSNNKPNGKRSADERLLRTIPFQLPVDIEAKTRQLITALGYNTGSIDMVVDEAGDYYFLELNPVGQYDFVSKICNYYLDEQVVNYLIDGQ